ncbi:HlyD family secretion protein [Vibrio paucivorans]
MNKFVRIISVLALVVFAWYVIADRTTPFTTNARVKAVVTPIIPRVEGMLIDVPAVNAQAVEAGELLARIDPRPYELVLQRRQAELESATQAAGASSAEVERAQAQLVRAQAKLDNTRVQVARVLELERKRLIPKSKGDEARSSLSDAEGNVSVALAELNSARQRLGSEGADNPKVRAALTNLATAELDLAFTELLAPSQGGVVNLNVAVGAQAQLGKPLMTFIDGRNIWVEAYMTENNVGHIKQGDRVDVLLDTHPGRVFEGRIESIVSAAYQDDLGADGLPNPQVSTKWLRDPQRFPVRIVLPEFQSADTTDDVKLYVNGQADVIVYTSDNWFMNTLGNLYIKLASVLSYVY